MTRLRWLLALPALLVATTGPSVAADIRDKANLFSSEAIKKAEADLDRIEKAYTIPVTIETIESLDGELIRDVTTRHAEEAKAKGLYLLISKKDAKIYVEASKDYRKALTRERLQTIDDAFIRQFKNKDYDAGLSRGVSQIESTVAEARPVAKTKRAGQPPIVGQPSSGGMMSLFLTIGLGLLALFIVIRILGALFGGGNRGYAGGQRMGGPGMGGPGMGGPGYGPGYGGGGGGGFMSSMFGGIGGALAGNWLYDQFSGRHHDTTAGASSYDSGAGAAPADTGPEWGAGGAEGSWGGGDAGAAGGDTGVGGDWGGGDAGGGGGDWGGGGGGDDGGSW
jgi:hypothetical protein